MRNERNKIKSDHTQEVILCFYIAIFLLKNSSTHRMKAIFILEINFLSDVLVTMRSKIP